MRSQWPVLCGLFLLALAVRALHLAGMADHPSFSIPLVDAATYHELALRFAETGTPGRGFFWQPPLYPLFLSGVHALSGGSIVAAKTLQAILGAVTCVLTCHLGRRLFDLRVGIVAGLIVALYGPLVYYETELLATGLATFWSIPLLLLLLRFREHRSPLLPLAFGILAALAVLTRPTTLLFVVVAAVWILALEIRDGGIGRPARSLALGLLGFAFLAAPFGLLNRSHGFGTFSILPLSGALNLYIGNNPDPCETLTARPGWEWSRLTNLPSLEGVDRLADHPAFFRERVRRFATGDPGGFVSGLAGKTLRFFGSREIPRNVDPLLFRDSSPVLRALLWRVGDFGFPFGILLPLAAIGGWLLRRRAPAVLWLFLASNAIAVILVFVSGRYRMPIIPVLSLLAAGGILGIVEMVRDGRWLRIGVVCSIGTGIAALSTIPGPFCEERLDYRAELDYLLGRSHYERAIETADPEEAAAELRDAERSYERALERRDDFADAWNELGNVHQVRGDPQEAMNCYAIALHHREDHARAWHNRGVILLGAKEHEEAIFSFRRALAQDPMYARTYLVLGYALLGADRTAEAAEAARRGLRIQSSADLRERLQALLAEARAASGHSAR
ncbi:MAG: tetratricopeptide repeat protein [Candidatus Eisenbacteria bacterium]|nr:tetratricopeptide repeat protein [Candidatus Latescibacterota bacterium]MBD3301237.1 tetratricopeptide repeat protein [Candidatus Eisenbacteria bacterium]